MPCDQLRVQLGNNSEPHWQGSSLRMMYLVRSASLQNIILRLRWLAHRAATAGGLQRPLAKVPLEHALRAGPLPPLLKRVLRAELRF